MNQVTWAMKPRTKVKLALLDGYLGAWFQIVGKSFPRALYFDGFCGPGIYSDGEDGSPLVAIKQANAACERNPNFKPIMIFNDLDVATSQNAKDRILSANPHPNIEYFVTNQQFQTFSENIANRLEKGWRFPTFAFIDPFGIKDTPFNTIQRLLEGPRSECIINFMAGWANRWAQHPNPDVAGKVPKLLGEKAIDEKILLSPDRIAAITDAYCNKLKECAQFVKKFQFLDESNVRDNVIFFCSNSSKGYKKVKESMWKIDPIQGGQFSEFDAENKVGGQADLFAPEPIVDPLKHKILSLLNLNGEMSAEVIFEWVDNETDYLSKHARIVLTRLQYDGFVDNLDPHYGRPLKGKWPDRVQVRLVRG